MLWSCKVIMLYKRLLINTKINDPVMLAYAAGKKLIDGVVLGDPFCLSRARIGLFDIPRLARQAKEKGLFVSYQTPVYLTSRNFDTILSLVENLVREGIADEIRIQDMGLLERIRTISASGVNIVWSIYGYQREFPGMDIPLNQGWIDFLKSHGVNSFEIISPVGFSIVDENYPLRFNIHVHHGKLDPITFSRHCYTETYTGQCCRDIAETGGRPPCDEPYFLQDEEGKTAHYVVDGYRLSEPVDPEEFRILMESDLEVEAFILEGNNIEEIESILEPFYFEPGQKISRVSL